MAAKKFLVDLDLNGNQLLNALLQLLGSDPGSPSEGQIWYNSATHVLKYRNNGATIVLGRLDQISAPTAAVNFNDQQATDLLLEVLSSDPGSPTEGRVWYNSTTQTLKVRKNSTTLVLGTLDQITPPAADLNLNSHKITGLLDGVADTDAATVSQVNAAVRGLTYKTAVRAATTAAGTLATSFENGDIIDGVTLATGDRILIKNQAAGAENGIYTVNASGAPTRAVDADSSAEVKSGMTVWVDEGTTNGDTGWTLTTDGTITLGTTALTFAKSGSAPTSTGTTTKYATSIGNGSLTSFTITHNLGSLDVVVSVFDNSTGDEVEPDVTHATTNTLTLVFNVAPTTNQYRVVVIG